MNNGLVREVDKLRRDLDIARGGTGAYSSHTGYPYGDVQFSGLANAATSGQAPSNTGGAAGQAYPPAGQSGGQETGTPGQQSAGAEGGAQATTATGGVA